MIGLGLIGGSVLRALSGRVKRLRGVDSDAATVAAVGNAGLSVEAFSDLGAGVQDADLIVLAAPVCDNIALLQQIPALAGHGAVIADLGSTKREIIDEMDRLPQTLRAVGLHPMCGREVGGFLHAEAALFVDKTIVICSSERSDAFALGLAKELIGALGARAVTMDARSHDRAVAHVSHLPYMLSAALVHASDQALDPSELALAASGFRDSSRLAGSQPQMITDILMTNGQPVLDALEAVLAAAQRAAFTACGSRSPGDTQLGDGSSQ